ncbi:portal protein p19 [Acinetobacter halotolerans]|uniref:Portal protein p19 n=1 Tax=Acinetobacter halotolerans TaxID=1752076 RepID=A0A4Q6XJB1_9GAMM|nr:portal protein [Acinetobacter halotolerans]RZF53684.1 portal protein p19 [Acinetobacter halotolerans]
MIDDEQKPKNDDDVISRIHKMCEDASDYWADNYDRAQEDRRFVTIDDEQWPESDRKARKAAGIPTLTFNVLRTYCRQQINSARLNRQQIKAEPVDDVADPKVAKIFNGLIRDTEISSGADNAYDAAVEGVVYGGFGAIRVHVDYVSPDSFQQEPKILTIHNPDSVYFDPLSKELDGSDARFVILESWVSKDEIAEQYGEDAVSNFDESQAKDTSSSSWYNYADKAVRIAEVFELQRNSADLYLLIDGTTTFDKPDDDTLIQNKRTSYKEVCWWYKVSGTKVLEDREFIVPMLPIVPVYGDVTWDGETRYVYSMIHFARDPQRLYNFWKSSEAQQIVEGLRKQYLVSDQASQDLECWDNPNDHQVLRYNSVSDEDGTPLPPPQQLPSLSALSGILNAADGAKQGIEEILNMQPAAMGQNVNNQSGRAIGLLQQRADVSFFHITDNLNKSLAQLGRILIGIYQKAYSVPMVKRITGEDNKAERVPLNTPAPPDETDGVIDGMLNNLTVGRYDIRMSTGPSYISQRQENKQALTELLQFVPQIGQAAPDLLVKAFDDGNMLEDIVERIKRSLNPVLTQEGEGDPQVEAVMQQYQQQMQELQAALQQSQAQLNDKNAELQIKFDIEKLKSETTLQVAQINNVAKAQLEELKGAIELILQQMQPPAEWMNVDLKDGQPPEPIPEQITPNPAAEQGFLMPDEQQMIEQQMLEQQAQQQNFAPDDGQIGIDAQNMAVNEQNPELDGIQGINRE